MISQKSLFSSKKLKEKKIVNIFFLNLRTIMYTYFELKFKKLQLNTF